MDSGLTNIAARPFKVKAPVPRVPAACPAWTGAGGEWRRTGGSRGPVPAPPRSRSRRARGSEATHGRSRARIGKRGRLMTSIYEQVRCRAGTPDTPCAATSGLAGRGPCPVATPIPLRVRPVAPGMERTDAYPVPTRDDGWRNSSAPATVRGSPCRFLERSTRASARCASKGAQGCAGSDHWRGADPADLVRGERTCRTRGQASYSPAAREFRLRRHRNHCEAGATERV
jgi:hypothetical protein